MTDSADRTLFQQALLKSLARATIADSNINPAEIESAQKIYQQVTGEAVNVSEIRVEARGEIFEAKPLAKYLSGIAGKLSADERKTIANSLAEVIKTDGRVSPFEIDFFNDSVKALGCQPSEIKGLED